MKKRSSKVFCGMLAVVLTACSFSVMPLKRVNAAASKAEVQEYSTELQNMPMVKENGGMLPDEVYNYEYYKEKYADLETAFGDNEKLYYKHFLEYGIYEGRSGCEAFNVSSYKNRYKDLQIAYGENMMAYIIHYLEYGIEEGRDGSLIIFDSDQSTYYGEVSITENSQTIGNIVQNNTDDEKDVETGNSDNEDIAVDSRPSIEEADKEGDVDGEIETIDVYLETELLTLINKERENKGLPLYYWDKESEQIAIDRASELARMGAEDQSWNGHPDGVPEGYTENASFGSYGASAVGIYDTYCSSYGHYSLFLLNSSWPIVSATAKVIYKNGNVQYFNTTLLYFGY